MLLRERKPIGNTAACCTLFLAQTILDFCHTLTRFDEFRMPQELLDLPVHRIDKSRDNFIDFLVFLTMARQNLPKRHPVWLPRLFDVIMEKVVSNLPGKREMIIAPSARANDNSLLLLLAKICLGIFAGKVLEERVVDVSGTKARAFAIADAVFLEELFLFGCDPCLVEEYVVDVVADFVFLAVGHLAGFGSDVYGKPHVENARDSAFHNHIPMYPLLQPLDLLDGMHKVV
mmetsp:Transcript_9404/g.17160  ORF Transcript_9404/g.17160 Transcript_9404/m.17160 type:complete len:231 (-) Transcript_9404:1377-2069(-)